MLTTMFFDKYEFAPRLFREKTISPIGKPTVIEMVRKDTIEDFSVSPTPTSTPTPQPKKKATMGTIEAKRAIVDASKYANFIHHIWLRESGRGTNTSGLNGYCLSQGKTNEFGFYPRGKYCFDSFEASVQRLERWREETAKGMSDNVALCYYNMGKKVTSCAYLGTDFLSMN